MAVRYELRQHAPDIIVAILTGQLNLGNRLAEFEHSIKQRIIEGSRKIILDLTGLTYIDSAGLGMVAACAGIIFKEGGSHADVRDYTPEPRYRPVPGL
jgi:anti-anti-sigma factor